jgi:hypothetical protein
LGYKKQFYDLIKKRKQRFVYWKIIVNLHTQNNSKTKVIRGLHLFCQREASKQIIAKQIKKR